MKTNPNQAKNINPTRKLSKAVSLPLFAAILILCNSALVGAAANLLPGLLPSLPGTSGNDPTVLYSLSVIGLTCGAFVLFGAAMLYLRPTNGKVWGIFIAGFSVPSVICGGGFIVGFLLGILGGKTAFAKKRIQKPL